MILCLVVLVQYWSVTYGRTHSSIYRTCIVSHGKKVAENTGNGYVLIVIMISF